MLDRFWQEGLEWTNDEGSVLAALKSSGVSEVLYELE